MEGRGTRWEPWLRSTGLAFAVLSFAGVTLLGAGEVRADATHAAILADYDDSATRVRMDIGFTLTALGAFFSSSWAVCGPRWRPQKKSVRGGQVRLWRQAPSSSLST